MAIADEATEEAEAGAEAIVTAMEMTTEVMGVIPDPMAFVVITPLAMVIVVLETPANSFIQVRREADEATEMAMAIPTMVMHLS